MWGSPLRAGHRLRKVFLGWCQSSYWGRNCLNLGPHQNELLVGVGKGGERQRDGSATWAGLESKQANVAEEMLYSLKII